MKSDLPIGVFDSGVGGLTVYKALKEVLPRESFIYLGDTARVPYGIKSAETIIKYSIQNAEYLVTLGIKMLVVACNTASSYALDALVEHLDIPVVGVIPSGVRKALSMSRNKRIGVIATQSTVQSESYPRLLWELDPSINVISLACPLFVPLVEEGWLDHPVTREVANLYLTPMREAGIDTLILGCTHYPMIKKVIGGVMGEDVRLVDSAEAIAGEIKQIVTALGIAKKGGVDSKNMDNFYVTDSVERFHKVAEIFLGRSIKNINHVDLQMIPKTDQKETYR